MNQKNCNVSENLLAQEYLRNEKIQIYIRLFFIGIALVSIYFYNQEHFSYSFSYIMIAPLSVLMDISLTVYVMYLVDSLTAYYAGALLWFSVAYGMRYGKAVAYTAYIVVLLCWIVLITTSDFWIQNRSFGVGWLLAYFILPLYYFKLVDKLHQNLDILHQHAEISEHKALHDDLTGISNRAMFEAELKKYLRQDAKFALFFIDLDAFKEINDMYGHDVGDRVLIEASRRIENIIEKSYRLGGDEFVCIKHYENENELKNIAKSLMFNLTMPCKDSKIVLSASIGIARYPDDARTEFDIKKRADVAMYAAKQAGKNRYYFYEEVA